MQTTSKLSAHDPDGVPHDIIGLTWVFALGAAICSFAELAIGGALPALALVAVPGLIVALGRRAERERETRTR